MATEQSDNATTNTAMDVLNLLKWISAKDNQNSLEQVADNCARGLEQFDEKVMESLKNEVKNKKKKILSIRD